MYIYIYKYIYIHIFIYIYIYIYIARKEVTLVFSLVELRIDQLFLALNITTEPGKVLSSTNINFEFSLVVLHNPHCQKLSADR